VQAGVQQSDCHDAESERIGMHWGRHQPVATPRSASLQLMAKVAFGVEKIGKGLRFGSRQA